MTQPRERRLRWPDFAGRARQRTEDVAEQYSSLAETVLDLLRTIECEAHDNPVLVRELALAAQRDVALIKSGLSDIRSWMVEAKRGRPPGD